MVQPASNLGHRVGVDRQVEKAAISIALQARQRIAAVEQRLDGTLDSTPDPLFALLRASELLALNVGDLDTDAGTVLVNGKGSKQRIVPIHSTAREALGAYLTARTQSGERFTTASPMFIAHPRGSTGERNPARNRLTMASLARLFRMLREHHGSDQPLHPHLIRHTFAVHLLQGGADLRHVQALLGHASPEATAKYLGLVKTDLKRAYDQTIELILNPPD